MLSSAAVDSKVNPGRREPNRETTYHPTGIPSDLAIKPKTVAATERCPRMIEVRLKHIRGAHPRHSTSLRREVGEIVIGSPVYEKDG